MLRSILKKEHVVALLRLSQQVQFDVRHVAEKHETFYEAPLGTHLVLAEEDSCSAGMRSAAALRSDGPSIL